MHELDYAGPRAAVAGEQAGFDPWPTLRVIADDRIEELMFVHEARLAQDHRALSDSDRAALARTRRSTALGSTAAQAVVLILPTIDAPASCYAALASALSKAGMCVARAELRGQGHSAVQLDGDSGYGDLIEHAIPAMITALRRRWPKLPLYLLGHGAGGQLACLYSAGVAAGDGRRAKRPRVDGLILVGASGADPLRKRITKLVRALASTRQPRARMRDWARAGRRLCGSTRDWDRALSSVRLPTLAISMTHDDDSPQAAVEALLARMPRARCQRLHLVDRDATHQGWLTRPEIVIDPLCRWHRQPRNRTGPNVRIALDLLPKRPCVNA